MTVIVKDWCAPLLFTVHVESSSQLLRNHSALSFSACSNHQVISPSFLSDRLPERFIQNDGAPQMLFIQPILSSSPPEMLISVLRLIKWCWSIWEANLCDTCYWRVSDKSCGASERQLDCWVSSGNTELFALCQKTSFNWHGTLLYKIKNDTVDWKIICYPGPQNQS